MNECVKECLKDNCRGDIGLMIWWPTRPGVLLLCPLWFSGSSPVQVPDLGSLGLCFGAWMKPACSLDSHVWAAALIFIPVLCSPDTSS